MYPQAASAVNAFQDAHFPKCYTRENPPPLTSNLPSLHPELTPHYPAIAGTLVAQLEARRAENPARRFMFNVMAANGYLNDDFKDLIVEAGKLWLVKVFMHHHSDHAQAAIEAANEIIPMIQSVHILGNPALVQQFTPSEQERPGVDAMYLAYQAMDRDAARVLEHLQQTPLSGAPMNYPAHQPAYGMPQQNVMSVPYGNTASYGSVGHAQPLQHNQPQVQNLPPEIFDTRNVNVVGRDAMGNQILQVPHLGQMAEPQYLALRQQYMQVHGNRFHGMVHHHQQQQQQRPQIGLNLGGVPQAGGHSSVGSSYGVGGSNLPGLPMPANQQPIGQPGGWEGMYQQSAPQPSYDAALAAQTAQVPATPAQSQDASTVTQSVNGVEQFQGRNVLRGNDSDAFYVDYDGTLPWTPGHQCWGIPLYDARTEKLVYKINASTGNVVAILRANLTEEDKVDISRHRILMDDQDRALYDERMKAALSKPARTIRMTSVTVADEGDTDSVVKEPDVFVPKYERAQSVHESCFQDIEQRHQYDRIAAGTASEQTPVAHTTVGGFVELAFDLDDTTLISVLLEDLQRANTLRATARTLQAAYENIEELTDEQVDAQALRETLDQIDNHYVRAINRRLSLELGIKGVSINHWFDVYDDLIEALDKRFGGQVVEAFLKDERALVKSILGPIYEGIKPAVSDWVEQNFAELAVTQSMVCAYVLNRSLTTVDIKLEQLLNQQQKLEPGQVYSLVKEVNPILWDLCSQECDRVFPNAHRSTDLRLRTSDGQYVSFARSNFNPQVFNLMVCKK